MDPAVKPRDGTNKNKNKNMNLEQLLSITLQHNASDLHLSAGLPPLFRIDGELKNLNLSALTQEDLCSLLKDYIDTKQHEIDFALDTPELARFRVNIFQQNRGIAAVFRAIPNHLPSLEQLQLPTILKTIATYKNGLVLITGATGSGKSTTLAAIINYINENYAHHIITIEDPIEFTHISKKSLINQREIHRDTLSFNNALRSALREDPDIILVGELRDLETIRLALTAAETGHLVFATLHTSSAAKTINRIIDVFPGEEKNLIRSLLAESLQAVICQTLVKKNSGGRAAACEIMIATPAIRNLIRENKIPQIETAIQTGSATGMQTIEQSLQKLSSLP